jgi:hypothetical protein
MEGMVAAQMADVSVSIGAAQELGSGGNMAGKSGLPHAAVVESCLRGKSAGGLNKKTTNTVADIFLRRFLVGRRPSRATSTPVMFSACLQTSYLITFFDCDI